MPVVTAWLPNQERSACGHIVRGTVNVFVYPLATTWCDTCGHYVQVIVEPRGPGDA